jgi:WD40 repeat protein
VSLYCWDLKSLDLPQKLPNNEGACASAWSKDGKRLAVGNQAGQLKVIDLSTGQSVHEQGMAEAIRMHLFRSHWSWAHSGKWKSH